MKSTKRIGNIGEIYTLAKLVELSIPIFIPFGDNERCDYVIDLNDDLKRIQVKTSTTNDTDKVVFDLCSYTYHRNNGTMHKYTIKEVDYFICYDIVTKQVYMIKNKGNMTSITLRYTKPKNNQIKNINLVEDYMIEKIIMPRELD